MNNKASCLLSLLTISRDLWDVTQIKFIQKVRSLVHVIAFDLSYHSTIDYFLLLGN